MKTFFILIILVACTEGLNAQLTNTKWEGTMIVPAETRVMLHFKKDSVDMIIAETGEVGETMTYTVQDSIIVMKKTSGFSPCTIGDTFKVKYVVKDGALFISNVADSCPERSQAWLTQPFTKVSDK